MHRPILNWTFSGFVALLAVGVAAHAADDWWDTSWPYRKRVQVQPGTHYGVEPAAVVAFATGGKLRSKGEDLRVVTPAGQIIPHYVIAAGFQDACTVAFPVRGDQLEYFLYYGNRAAVKPGTDWRPGHGLIYEVRQKGKGGYNNARQALELLENSPKVLGRQPHVQVFDAHNPFGRSDNYIGVYRGFLYCPVSGKYSFATTSDDASFLLLDGKLVVAWPGSHGAVADARHNASIDLKKGIRRFEYYHVEGGGGQTAVAAWRLPGQEDYSVIPPEAFMPFWPAAVTDFETADGKDELDFAFWQSSSLWAGNVLVSEMQFKVQFPETARRAKQEWSFGDGTSSTDRDPGHVYAEPGEYRVTLRVGDAHLAQDVRVWENERIAKVDADKLATHYARAVQEYDLPAMEESALVAFADFGYHTKQSNLRFAAMNAMIEREGRLASARSGDMLLEYAETLRGAGQEGPAMTVLSALAERHTRRETCCAALLRQGELYLIHEMPAKAQEAFRLLTAKAEGHHNLSATAQAATGDYYRYKGDKTMASKFYERAAEMLGHEDVSTGRGGSSQAALSYLRRGEAEAALEEVKRWEDLYPPDRLDGYLSVLKAEALLLRGDLQAAYAEVRDLVAANEASNYAAQALLVMGDALALGGETDRANACYRRIIEEHPDAPFLPVVHARQENPPRDLANLTLPVVHF